MLCLMKQRNMHRNVYTEEKGLGDLYGTALRCNELHASMNQYRHSISRQEAEQMAISKYRSRTKSSNVKAPRLNSLTERLNRDGYEQKRILIGNDVYVLSTYIPHSSKSDATLITDWKDKTTSQWIRKTHSHATRSSPVLIHRGYLSFVAYTSKLFICHCFSSTL